MTKKIEFTQNELSSLFGFLAMNGQQLPEDINTKVKAALHGPNGCTVSLTDTEICFTPAAAYQKVSERKEKAKIENEKAVAKRMIKELEQSNNEAVQIIQGISSLTPIKGEIGKLVLEARDFINNKLF